MNSSKCEHVRQLARQVRQRRMIHQQPDQRMQEVGECSFDLIECHGCTVLMSAIGRMTRDSEATPSLWHRAGDASQPVARPVWILYWVLYWVVYWVLYWVLYWIVYWVLYWILYWMLYCVLYWILYWALYWVLYWVVYWVLYWILYLD